jgi:hypothetical protein
VESKTHTLYVARLPTITTNPNTANATDDELDKVVHIRTKLSGSIPDGADMLALPFFTVSTMVLF